MMGIREPQSTQLNTLEQGGLTYPAYFLTDVRHA